MATRILSPVRDREGWLHHRCPLNDGEIDPSTCQTCPHLNHVEERPSKYRLHCDAPSTGPELIEFDPPKAYDSHMGLKGTDLLNSSAHTWLEPKLDGARAIVHCTPDGVFITSRRRDRTGKFNQFQDNIPHIRDHEGLNQLGASGYTIVDAEIIMPVDTDTLATTMGVVGSGPERAIALQKEKGLAVLHIFDLARAKNLDMTWEHLHQRRGVLEDFEEAGYFDGDYIELVKIFRSEDAAERKNYLDSCLEAGLEGSIAKDPNASYFESHAWLKLKQKITVDAIVTGWEHGAVGGKYADTLGALKVSVQTPHDGLVEIAKVVPGDDKVRGQLFSTLKELEKEQILGLAIVVEMESQGWTKDYRLRHPRILRYRKDRSEPNTVEFEMLATL